MGLPNLRGNSSRLIFSRRDRIAVAALVDLRANDVLCIPERGGEIDLGDDPWASLAAAGALGRELSWRKRAFAKPFAFHGVSSVTVDGNIPGSIGLFFEAKFCVNGAGEIRQCDDEGEHLETGGLFVGADVLLRLLVGL